MLVHYSVVKHYTDVVKSMYQLNLNILEQIMFHEIIQLVCMCVINLHYAKVAFCIASNSRKYNKTLFFYIFLKTFQKVFLINSHYYEDLSHT